ncbi:MAG: PKD domain-containing protein [Saprospiraceae bacterium]
MLDAIKLSCELDYLATIAPIQQSEYVYTFNPVYDTDIPAEDVITYSWDFGDGTTATTAGITTHTFQATEIIRYVSPLQGLTAVARPSV